MTREENLYWLNQEIQTWENECQSRHPVKEALYAARKALKQEPTLEKDGTLIVTTEHYKNVGRVLVQCGTNGALFYQDQEPTTKNDCAKQNGCISCSLDDDDDCCRKLYEENMQDLTTKNDLEVDWESCKDVDGNSLDDLILEVLQNNFDCGNTYGYKVADEIIGLLPPVTPQNPRKGHWVKEESPFGWDEHSYQCSECGRSIHLDTEMENLEDYPYCHCGAKMQEVK